MLTDLLFSIIIQIKKFLIFFLFIRYHSFTVNPLVVNVTAKVKKANATKDKKESVVDEKKNDNMKVLDLDVLDIKAEVNENENEEKVNATSDFGESKIDTDNRILDM